MFHPLELHFGHRENSARPIVFLCRCRLQYPVKTCISLFILGLLRLRGSIVCRHTWARSSSSRSGRDFEDHDRDLILIFKTTLSEVDSRTQGSWPRLRPRIQKKSEAKAKDSLSKDRTSRGQGQESSRPRTGMLEAKAKDRGHRRKRSPKKKGLQKYFSGDIQFIGVPKFLIKGRPKPQIT